MAAPRSTLTFACLVLIWGWLGAATAQITPSGLGTRVNGSAFGRCSAGSCAIQGGVKTGANLFHRFGSFDTRHGITDVKVDVQGQANVIFGVVGPQGFFLNTPLRLTTPANLFLLSPRGIWLGSGASFANVPNLLLSTSFALGIGAERFDLFGGSADAVSSLSGSPAALWENPGEAGLAFGGQGAITLAGGLISVDRHLVIDAGSGPIRAPGAAATTLRSGESVRLSGGAVELNGVALEAGQGDELGPITLEARSGDLQLASSQLLGSRLNLSGQDVAATGSQLRAPDGLINVRAEGELQLTSGELLGRRLSLSGQDVAATGSQLRAPDGTIAVKAEGTLKLASSQLLGQTLSLSGQDVAATGSQLRAPDGTIAVKAEGTLKLASSQLLGQTLSLSGQDVAAAGSQLRAPGGSITVRAERELQLVNSQLDVAWSDAFPSNPQAGIELPPSIALASGGRLRLAQTLLNTFTDPQEAGGAPPPRSRSGLVVLQAAQGMALEASAIVADGSNSPAGEIVLVVDGQEGAEGLRIAGSRLSASQGMGGGKITLASASGITLDSSALVAAGDRFPLINGSAYGPLAVDGEGAPWRPYGFKGGQITLVNSSSSAPISVAQTQLLALQTTNGGGLSSHLLTHTPGEQPGFYGNDLVNPAFGLGYSSGFSGGVIRIGSKGGIAIGEGTLIDASSRVEGSHELANIAGTIELLNNGPRPIQITDSSLLARSGPALDGANQDHAVGQIVVLNTAAIAIGASRLDAFADASGSLTQAGEASLVDVQSEATGGVSFAGAVLLDASTLLPLEGGPRTGGGVNIVGWAGRAGDGEVDVRAPLTTDTYPIGEVDTGVLNLERLRDLFLNNAAGQLEPSSSFSPAALAVVLTAAPAATPVGVEPLVFRPPQAVASLEQAAESAVAITISLNQEAPAAALSEWQQRTLAATAQQLGLSPSAGKLRSIAELQQRLGQASQRSPLAPYSPAILNLQREDQPTGTTRLTAILLTANGEPLSRSLELPRARLDGWIRSFQRQLSRRAAAPANPERDPARLLAQALLEPLAPALRERGVTALLVEADRGLQAIPFAALPLDGRPLGEALALTITPALGLIDLDPARLGQPSGKAQLLLAGATSFRQGLEPLPMVRQELQALAAEHPATLLLDGAFTPSALLEQARAPGVRQLHIATHANFLPGQASNGLLYTPTTALSLAELGRGLRARASTSPLDQITLSGCLTALGDERSELGFVGMALQAGARSGLGTLWEVDDAATAAFFIQYYRYLKQGLPKDQALQATQRAFLRQEVRLEGDRLVGPDPAAPRRRAPLVGGLEREHQSFFAQGLDHPYFWAGMVLSGSPW
jgi:filamentous hemagglutinin family protein